MHARSLADQQSSGFEVGGTESCASNCDFYAPVAPDVVWNCDFEARLGIMILKRPCLQIGLGTVILKRLWLRMGLGTAFEAPVTLDAA